MWMVGIGWYWGIIWGHEHPFASGFVFCLRWTEGRQSFDILWHIVTLLVYPLVVDPPKIWCFMACGTLVYWIGCPSSHRHLKNCFYTNGNRKWRNNCRLANIQPIEILIGFHFWVFFCQWGTHNCVPKALVWWRWGWAVQLKLNHTPLSLGLAAWAAKAIIYALSWYLGYIETIFFIHLYSPCGSFSFLIICNDAILRQDPHQRKSHWILLFNYSFTIGF